MVILKLVLFLYFHATHKMIELYFCEVTNEMSGETFASYVMHKRVGRMWYHIYDIKLNKTLVTVE